MPWRSRWPRLLAAAQSLPRQIRDRAATGAAEAGPGLAVAACSRAMPSARRSRCRNARSSISRATANWDAAFDTLVDAFKSLNDYLDKQGIKPTGPAMTIYTQTDDTGFSFQAALPVAEAPKDPPKGDIAVGPAPAGKALKFVHRGSYDAMDSTYEAITNYLDDKQLEAKDLFIEEYATDPVKTEPGQAGRQCVRAGEVMIFARSVCIDLGCRFACRQLPSLAIEQARDRRPAKQPSRSRRTRR